MAACGAGSWTDHDDLVFAVTSSGPGDQTAAFDPVLKAPVCATVGRSCDSGPTLLLGRDGKGPEPNQPNTINASCADGTLGTYHADESNDRIAVSTVDGSGFAAARFRYQGTPAACLAGGYDDHDDLVFAVQ